MAVNYLILTRLIFYRQSARRGQFSYSSGSESRTRKLRYVYSMGISYGANFNMADRTAGQVESTLRVLRVNLFGSCPSQDYARMLKKGSLLLTAYDGHRDDPKNVTCGISLQTIYDL